MAYMHSCMDIQSVLQLLTFCWFHAQVTLFCITLCILFFPEHFKKVISRAHLEPVKKYTYPQTEAQEVGWITRPLVSYAQCLDGHFIHCNFFNLMHVGKMLGKQTMNWKAVSVQLMFIPYKFQFPLWINLDDDQTRCNISIYDHFVPDCELEPCILIGFLLLTNLST